MSLFMLEELLFHCIRYNFIRSILLFSSSMFLPNRIINKKTNYMET